MQTILMFHKDLHVHQRIMGYTYEPARQFILELLNDLIKREYFCFPSTYTPKRLSKK